MKKIAILMAALLLLTACGTQNTVETPDTVIMSIGYRSVPSMAEALSGCGAEIYEIGDGNRVGNVLTCIQDAYEVASHL